MPTIYDYLEGTWIHTPNNVYKDDKFTMSDEFVNFQIYNDTTEEWDVYHTGPFTITDDTITVDSESFRGEPGDLIETNDELVEFPYTNSSGDIYHNLTHILKFVTDSEYQIGFFHGVYLGGDTSDLQGTWVGRNYYTCDFTPNGGTMGTREMIYEETWVFSGNNITITKSTSYLFDSVYETGYPDIDNKEGTFILDTVNKEI